MTLCSHTKGLFELGVKFLFSAAKAKQFKNFSSVLFHYKITHFTCSLLDTSAEFLFYEFTHQQFYTKLLSAKKLHICDIVIFVEIASYLVQTINYYCYMFASQSPPCPKLQYYCIVSNFVLFSEENCKNSKELGLQKTVCYCLSLVINSVLLFGGNRISE